MTGPYASRVTEDLFELNEPPRLEARASHIKAKGLALPGRRCAHGRPADVGPAQRAQCGLQRRPIELAVAQKDHLGPLGDHRAYPFDHSAGELLGTMAFGPLTHAPRQGRARP